MTDALDRVGFAPALGRGRSARWAFPHRSAVGGPCTGRHGSTGEAAIFFATNARILVCRDCGANLTSLEIVAASIGLEVPGTWDESAMAPVRAAAASLGWCDDGGRPWSDADRARAEAQRERRRQDLAREEAERSRRRLVEGIDVGQAWAELQAHRGGFDGARVWALDVRGWPVELVHHLPTDEVTAAVEGLAGHAGRLCAEAEEKGYSLMLALRDGGGDVRSVERRWPLAGIPPSGPDGKPKKTMALPSDRIIAGPSAGWEGGVRVFGSVPRSVAAAALGQPLAVLEGGPDFLVAESAFRLAGRGAALGSPSVGEQAKVARALRAALETAGISAHMVRVVVVAHKGTAGEEAGKACSAALEGARSVKIATLPPWAGDLADLAKGLHSEDRRNGTRSAAAAVVRIITEAPKLARGLWEHWPEEFRGMVPW